MAGLYYSASVLLALAAAALLWRLDAFPALTLDESWLGLFAARLRDRGLYTPHAMNTYTSALYALGLAGSIRLLGSSVLALRLPGALANIGALGGRGPWLPLLALGSVYYMTKSRLAWEVYALQPLLIAASWALLKRGGRGVWFTALCVVGALNHFIYISVPLSLVLLFDRVEDDERRRIALSGLAASAVVYLVKPRLPEAGWEWSIALFAALPLLALAPWRIPRLPRALWWLAAAFAAWHGLAFLQVLSGPLVWKRVMSWDAPWWYDAPLYLWGAFLLGLMCWRGARAWHSPRKSFDDALALWPFAYMAVFLLFRHTSSLRYYSPLHFISLLALADGLDRHPDERPLRRAAVLAALLVQVPLWTELSAPADRRPLEFRSGWRLENSWDFARKDALFAAFDAAAVCEIGQKNSFVDLPLFWRRESRPRECGPGRFWADYRREGGPPWHRWSVTGPAARTAPSAAPRPE
jgi:hypothetical protein